MLSLPSMHMLSPPPLSGFLIPPLSLLPPLPCGPPSFPRPLDSSLSLLVWLPCPIWPCCSFPLPLVLTDGARVLLLLPSLPMPPHKDCAFLSNADCPTHGGLVPHLWQAPPCALGAAPDLVEFAGTLQREAGGGGWLLVACSACAVFGG